MSYTTTIQFFSDCELSWLLFCWEFCLIILTKVSNLVGRAICKTMWASSKIRRPLCASLADRLCANITWLLQAACVGRTWKKRSFYILFIWQSFTRIPVSTIYSLKMVKWCGRLWCAFVENPNLCTPCRKTDTEMVDTPWHHPSLSPPRIPNC